MRQLLLTVLSLFAAVTGCHQQPKHAVTARVTDVYLTGSKYRPARAVITFQSGRLIGDTTLLAALNRCKIGDQVHAMAQGVSLTIERDACRRT